VRSLPSILGALTFFIGFGIPARAQDASKIVDQYIKAAGGAKAISKIQTLAIEGTFTSDSDGKAGTFTFDTKLPNRYYSELGADGKNWIEAYNGKSAWHQNGAGEVATFLAIGSRRAVLQRAATQFEEEQAGARVGGPRASRRQRRIRN
jgi:hypothetical protein